MLELQAVYVLVDRGLAMGFRGVDVDFQHDVLVGFPGIPTQPDGGCGTVSGLSEHLVAVAEYFSSDADGGRTVRVCNHGCSFLPRGREALFYGHLAWKW